MNFQLIIGKAGSGKSTYIFNKIKEEIGLDKKIYVITPEQFSYASEKKLLETLGKSASINCEILSFNRLADRVMAEVGGLTKTNLSKSSKAMLVYSLLDKQKKNLKFLGNSNENVELMLTIITELKKHNVDISKIEEVKKEIEDIYLETKMQDVSLIYNLYEECIKNKYIDEDDKLTLLAKKLDKSEMLDGQIVYIDEFAGFTEQEYMVINKILRKAEKVVVTICGDPEGINILTKLEEDIFYYNKKTAMRLIEEARQIGIKEEIVLLKEKYRFKNNELKHLEENIYEYRYKKYEQKPQNISLFFASNPYSELEYVAQNIIKLVREKGLKYSDISVITKDTSEIESIAKTVFNKYEIPIFVDQKEDLNQNIAVKYILGIIDIFARNWSTNSVFAYLKSGLYEEISKEDIYKLENYCVKWGIKGTKWYKEDWLYDQEEVDIEKLNRLRKTVTMPLLELKKDLDSKKTAKEITTALYMFIEKNNIREKLNRKIEQLLNIGETYLAEEYKKSFNILIDILDEIVLVFAEDRITFDKYKNILQTGLKNSDLGKIPQVIDQVIIGDIGRSKTSETKALFIIGINDGVFPRKPKSEGFLNDNDREQLKERGIELAKTTVDVLYEEQFNIYKAFTISEEAIFLSYLSSDKDGKALRPSILISKIKKIFPQLGEQSDIIRKQEEIMAINPTFELLLENIKQANEGIKIEDIWVKVYKWFENKEKWKEKLYKVIKGIENRARSETLSKENVKRLYGENLKTSISRLERYKKCPFSYYLEYGLKLKEKGEFRITPINTGSFMHEVIDEFMCSRAATAEAQEIEEEELKEIIYKIIEEKLSLSKNYIFTTSPKFILLANRLKKVILKSVKYILEQISNSDFEVQGNEVEFREKIGEVELVGKIDRIDVAENEEGKYIRIIDYKSSSQDINLNEMIFGTQIQLITYIDCIANKQEAAPSGMLYFKLIDPIIKANKNLTEEELEEEIRKEFKMAGLILADVNVIKMMDKSLENGESSVVPVSLTTKRRN